MDDIYSTAAVASISPGRLIEEDILRTYGSKDAWVGRYTHHIMSLAHEVDTTIISS